MRIKGVTLEEAAPGVQRLYRKVAQLLGRGHHPANRFRALPGDRRDVLGAGRCDYASARGRAAAQDARVRAHGADRGVPFLSGHQLCRGQRAGYHRRATRRPGEFENSTHFNPLEKTVLRYAEGMTHNPAEVADPISKN